MKCGTTRDEADEWLARYPDDAAVMAYIGRSGWNTLSTVGAISDDEIRRGGRRVLPAGGLQAAEEAPPRRLGRMRGHHHVVCGLPSRRRPSALSSRFSSRACSRAMRSPLFAVSWPTRMSATRLTKIGHGNPGWNPSPHRGPTRPDHPAHQRRPEEHPEQRLASLRLPPLDRLGVQVGRCAADHARHQVGDDRRQLAERLGGPARACPLVVLVLGEAPLGVPLGEHAVDDIAVLSEARSARGVGTPRVQGELVPRQPRRSGRAHARKSRSHPEPRK